MASTEPPERFTNPDPGSPTTVSALVVASGVDSSNDPPRPTHNLVVAADGGLEIAVSMGLDVDVVVGDMDSVGADALAAAESSGVEIERHSTDKDESDLELAIAAALERGAALVHVILGEGGRLDHAIANLAVLASPRWSGAAVGATVGSSRVWVVRKRRTIPLSAGEHVALVPVGGPAVGVSTEGLRYSLSGETLDPFAARGIANQVAVANPTVEVSNGVVLVISSPTPSNGPSSVRG